MEDALAPANNFAIRLPVFEGPLDLLLYLIRRNEIDIYDIPMEKVTRQYIDIIHAMKTPDLKIAGEFFIMASTLMYIKSRMLLPPKDQGPDQAIEDDSTDPRRELVQQLLEYRKFKKAASEIEELIAENHDRIARTGFKNTIRTEKRPIKPIASKDLWDIFNHILQRLSERISTGEIHAEQITVADRMQFIIKHFRKTPVFLFTDLFDQEVVTPTKIIATFLAVLELTRLGELKISQDHAFADIHCRKVN